MDDVIVCAKIADLDHPVEGSEQTTCHLCGCELWIGPESVLFRAERGLKTECLECALGHADENDEFVVNAIPGSRDERTYPAAIIQAAFRELVRIHKREKGE